MRYEPELLRICLKFLYALTKPISAISEPKERIFQPNSNRAGHKSKPPLDRHISRRIYQRHQPTTQGSDRNKGDQSQEPERKHAFP